VDYVLSVDVRQCLKKLLHDVPGQSEARFGSI
jgi:hypothetical protein